MVQLQLGLLEVPPQRVVTPPATFSSWSSDRLRSVSLLSLSFVFNCFFIGSFLSAASAA
jgi:hypothetical protein